MQDCSNSSALAMKLQQSCTKPLPEQMLAHAYVSIWPNLGATMASFGHNKLNEGLFSISYLESFNL